MIEIKRLEQVDAAAIEGLAELLMDAVDGGASVSFMAPMSQAKAIAFWQDLASAVALGERLLLVAEDEQGRLLGTVQLVLAQADNQPHRADLAKLLVHRSVRRQGLGAKLMRAAETAAAQAGKTLLVLDTVTGGDGERLYASLGWQRVGAIPDYALMPDGALCSTTVFYKRPGKQATAT